MEWISVDDRLPEKNGDVLVCTEDDYVCSAGYSNYGKPTFLIDSMYGGDELDDVTHWMPLPPAPSNEKIVMKWVDNGIFRAMGFFRKEE